MIEASPPRPESHWDRARRPLAALVAITPIMAGYEVGWLLAGDAHGVHLVARVAVQRVADLLAGGVAPPWRGFVVAVGPPVAVIGALLAAHVARGDPWRVRAGTCVGIWLEAILLTAPLFALGGAVFPGDGGAAAAGDAVPPAARVLLGLGAGLYEELVFRLFGLSLIRLVLAKGLRVPGPWATGLAVGLTSLLFAAHHFVPPTTPWAAGQFAFLAVAGAYLGGVYVARGFGVAVVVHALYDTLLVALTAG